MNAPSNDYGLWGLVVLNSVIFVGFAYSFFKPTTLRDWRSFGAYSAFVVALFAEMYGFPLTIYLLSGWLGTKFPGVNLFGHDAGHLWWLVTGQQGNPHFGVFHLLSFLFLFAGFTLLSNAWHVLYHAQRRHQLATAGPYRLVRHPQYIGFAYSFFKPLNVRDWRSFGAYSAFVVALFAEMYGFPLTIYLLSGWLG
jgi:protein-S-isoprenylcysteine O-methyltransferase Ste14